MRDSAEKGDTFYEPKTPCDIYHEEPDEEGNHYFCPYKDSYTGYESEMCRVCCGEGVDE